MKKSKFTDSQIIEALKRVEAGLSVPEICRELGISSATFYKWRAKFGGMDVSMISRLKVNRPGNHGGCLVKVKQLIQTAWRVASSSLPLLRLAVYTRWVPAGTGG